MFLNTRVCVYSTKLVNIWWRRTHEWCGSFNVACLRSRMDVESARRKRERDTVSILSCSKISDIFSSSHETANHFQRAAARDAQGHCKMNKNPEKIARDIEIRATLLGIDIRRRFYRYTKEWRRWSSQQKIHFPQEPDHSRFSKVKTLKLDDSISYPCPQFNIRFFFTVLLQVYSFASIARSEQNSHARDTVLANCATNLSTFLCTHRGLAKYFPLLGAGRSFSWIRENT